MAYRCLLKNCMLSFIAHAIMTNIYPELAFEQAWDNCNYSIQDGCGIRGTITFQDGFCVGAIRNEHGKYICGNGEITTLMDGFPNHVIEVANTETLQYLLDDFGDEVVPVVTSIFWCDENGLHWGKQDKRQISADYSLVRTCLLPFDRALEHMMAYYEMAPSTVRLLLELVEQKENDLTKQVFLSKQQMESIPGNKLSYECKDALNEILIFSCDV